MPCTISFDDADLSVIDEQVYRLQTFTEAMADGHVEKAELEPKQETLVVAELQRRRRAKALGAWL